MFKIRNERNIGQVDFLSRMHYKFIIVDIHIKIVLFYNTIRCQYSQKKCLWLLVCHSGSLMENRVNINTFQNKWLILCHLPHIIYEWITIIKSMFCFTLLILKVNYIKYEVIVFEKYKTVKLLRPSNSWK